MTTLTQNPRAATLSLFALLKNGTNDTWQVEILEESRGCVLLQFFSWISGEPTHRAWVPAVDLAGAQIFDSHEKFLEAGAALMQANRAERPGGARPAAVAGSFGKKTEIPPEIEP